MVAFGYDAQAVSKVETFPQALFEPGFIDCTWALNMVYMGIHRNLSLFGNTTLIVV